MGLDFLDNLIYTLDSPKKQINCEHEKENEQWIIGGSKNIRFRREAAMGEGQLIFLIRWTKPKQKQGNCKKGGRTTNLRLLLRASFLTMAFGSTPYATELNIKAETV